MNEFSSETDNGISCRKRNLQDMDKNIRHSGYYAWKCVNVIEGDIMELNEKLQELRKSSIKVLFAVL